MKAAEQMVLEEYLKQLRLPAMLKGYAECARQAVAAQAGFEQFLLQLTEREVQQRQQNQLARRLRQARFPQMKTLEQTQFPLWPKLSAATFQALVQGDYIAKHENLIFIGKHGTGKTHAAVALGIEACRQGWPVLFTTAADLVNTLVEAQEDKQLRRLLQRLKKVSLLIIDELGYLPFSQTGAQLLFQVFTDRYERGSVILTSNLPYAQWNTIFSGDANLTAALLDRLNHYGTTLVFDWESVRFTQSLQRQKSRSSRRMEG